MLRLLAACSITVVLAACGGHAPAAWNAASATATPTPPPALQMIKPPVAVWHDIDGYSYLDVWVRLNRPIERSDVVPDENGDQIISLEALQAPSISGANADVRFPTCYTDAFDVGEIPAEGKPVEIELTLGPNKSLKGTATLQYHTHDTHPARQLGCPRDPEGHICFGKVVTKYLTIRPETAYATSCGVALEVFKRVGRWANPRRCKYTLCVSKHRMNRGFRCDAYFDNGGEGPPAFQIACTKGRARITAFAD